MQFPIKNGEKQKSTLNDILFLFRNFYKRIKGEVSVRSKTPKLSASLHALAHNLRQIFFLTKEKRRHLPSYNSSKSKFPQKKDYDFFQKKREKKDEFQGGEGGGKE